jgi:hypothetical protein
MNFKNVVLSLLSTACILNYAQATELTTSNHAGVKKVKPSTSNKYFHPPMHLLPDDSSEDHAAQLRKLAKTKPYLALEDAKKNELLEVVIAAGERNLDWLKLINSKRAPNKQLSFTSPNTRKGSPIDAPNKYSPSIIRGKFNDFIAQSPEAFISVISGTKSIPPELSLPEAEFLNLGLNLDRLYQSATRWTLMEPYLKEMTENSAYDVRGYYFLSKIENLNEKLKNYKHLPGTEKAQLKIWLLGLCRNSDAMLTFCESTFSKYNGVFGKGLMAYYQKFLPNGKARYDANFQVPAEVARKDIVWTSENPNVATIPFLEPEPAIKEFMLNVEDEWKWDGWQLKLDFKKEGFAIPFVVFVPGITPNVESLGGNKITMDANAPLTEWEPTWTIRHEFGHVLGFTDCYVEFYDVKEQVMVNYQLDITNLMCSRAGNLLKTHYDEMKRVYFKAP